MLELLVIHIIDGHMLFPITEDNIAEQIEDFTIDMHYSIVCVLKDKVELKHSEVLKLIESNEKEKLKSK